MVKNYTGDRGQFGMACEMCEMDDINAKIVIADDDVAVKDSTFTAGRRGVAGAILGYKIVCAAAEEGKSLDELVELADRVNANVRSMGFGLTSCTTPAKGAPTFEIGDDEMEIGVGLHGEPGRQRTKLMPADEIVGLMTQNCLDDLPFQAGDEVAVMVNGLGGTPLMEQYIAYNKVAQMLKDSGRAQELNLPSAPKQFLHYFEEADRPQTKLDRNLEGGMAVSIGRLREDTQYDYKFVCLSHNTLRGAAGGAVLLAELLCAEGYIDAK